MKQRFFLILVALLVALCGVVQTAHAETATISGEVEATEYDEDGNVIEVAIYDDDWGSVLVWQNEKGAELLDLVGAIVSATGDLREHDDDPFPYTISVTDYTVEEPAEPEGDSKRTS